jgi:hypothetical protein
MIFIKLCTSLVSPEGEVDLGYLKQRVTSLVNTNFRRDIQQIEISI